MGRKRRHWNLTAAVAAACLTAPAGAVVRTVGPTGTYATIQEAVDVAVAAGGYNDIRVAAGTYREGVTVPAAFASGSMDIRGGWEPSFRVRSRDETVTVVDGGGVERPFVLRPTGGRLQVEGFTITNGLAEHDPSSPAPVNSPDGGGVYVELTGSALVVLVDNLISGNAALNDEPVFDGPTGGGVFAYLRGSTEIRLVRNRITENRAEASTSDGTGVGGGIWAGAEDSARVRVEDNRIQGNATQAVDNQNTGSGAYLTLRGGASGRFHGNTVTGNTARRLGSVGGNVGVGAALWQSADSTGTLDIRRNRFLDNVGSGRSVDQVEIINSGTGTVYFTDSVIAGGDADGLRAFTSSESTLHMSNLTVVDNVHSGVLLGSDGLGTTTLFNSILYGNGMDLGPVRGGPAIVATLIGVDPRFRDPAARDYRLRAGSPAIDAGVDPLVPRERLGARDLDGNRRVAGTAVDQGAHETASSPREPETPCGVFAGPSGPIPRWTPACLCFSDPSIREFRCRLSAPDLALELRVPLPLEVGRPFALEWTAFPQAVVENLRIEVELPPGLEAVNRQPPYVLKLESQPGQLGRAKLAVKATEAMKAYAIGGRLTADAAGPDRVPIELELEMPVEATLPQDGPDPQQAGEQARQAPPGAR